MLSSVAKLTSYTLELSFVTLATRRAYANCPDPSAFLRTTKLDAFKAFAAVKFTRTVLPSNTATEATPAFLAVFLVTFTVQTFFFLPYFAVILVVPAFLAFTTPFLDTAATFFLLLFHLILVFLETPLTFNFFLLPTFNEIVFLDLLLDFLLDFLPAFLAAVFLAALTVCVVIGTEVAANAIAMPTAITCFVTFLILYLHKNICYLCK